MFLQNVLRHLLNPYLFSMYCVCVCVVLSLCGHPRDVRSSEPGVHKTPCIHVSEFALLCGWKTSDILKMMLRSISI